MKLISEKKSIGLLLDPDKAKGDSLTNALKAAEECRPDIILAGGSLSSGSISTLIREIKNNLTIPVVLFPGNLLQLDKNADAIMFLSLISGRNPELLIGNHVVAAPYLSDVRDKVIPVGYILISCGKRTSVEYMSQTEAIPEDKTDIAVATALAGEMLGLKMIYLEAGSGSAHPVPAPVVKAVRENISLPLIVGGGIKTESDISHIFSAGADLIVLGNGCENNSSLLYKACEIRDSLRNPLV
jgi:putative glycerol-1-phosphate prenyltransferase